MNIVYLILAICSFMVLTDLAGSFRKIALAWSYWMQQQIVRDQLDGLNEAIEEAAENAESLKKNAA